MKLPTSSDYPLIIHGDCVEVLKGLPDGCIDAVVTDPPYELGFMGKSWDASGIANSVELWSECFRVLKPGGHALIFGGTRTFHRMAVAVEDAGFEIRDSIAWLYGSGFPKSLNVSKALDKHAGATREVVGERRQRANAADSCVPMNASAAAPTITAPATDAAKQWDGWGTALKPAFEPIVVARKPLSGTVAANVVEHGTGALNVDGCRIGTTVETWPSSRSYPYGQGGATYGSENADTEPTGAVPLGRWPANVVLDDYTAAIVDEQSGASASVRSNRNSGAVTWGTYGDTGDDQPRGYDDTGGASRFFYTAKAPGQERPSANGVAHPTVKPLDLMRWLVRLVTPPGGLVLEPFAGSGTTVEACIHEHMRCVAIEREADYLPLIDERINRNNLSLFAGGEA